jgi:WD40 repeat protein/uncharacterized caspase-like protein
MGVMSRFACVFLVLVGCGSKPASVRVATPNAPPPVCGPALSTADDTTAIPLIQTAHGGPVTELELSGDGYLATYSQFDHTIRIWDLANRTELSLLQMDAELGWDDDAHALVLTGRGHQAHDYVNDDLLLAPDGHELGDRRGTLTAKSVRDGDRTRFKALVATDKDYAFGDHHLARPKVDVFDHPQLVAGGHELVAWSSLEIVRWSLDQEPAAPVVTPLTEALAVGFSDAGDAVVIEKKDYAWYARTLPRDGKPGRDLASGDALSDPKLVVSRDGTRTVIATSEYLWVFDVATGKIVWSERGAAFDPKRDRVYTPGFWDLRLAGDELIVARFDGSIVLRDLATGRPLGELGHAVHQPRTVAWVDPTHLLSANNDRAAVWDVTRGTIDGAYTEPRGFLSAAVVGGDVVVARQTLCFGPAGSDPTTIAWVDRWTGSTPPAQLLAGDKVPALRAGCGATKDVAWPPKRGLAAVPIALAGAGDNSDLRTGSSLGPSSPKFMSPIDSARHADGSMVKLAGLPRGIQDLYLRGDTVATLVQRPHGASAISVWRASDGAHVRYLTLKKHNGSGEEIETGHFLGISDDGTRIAVTDGGDVGVFDVASGTQLVRVTLKEWPSAIAFGKDPRDAWIATERGTVHHLDATGKDTPAGTTGSRVVQLALSPDASRIAAVGGDGGLRIVDGRTGTLEATLVEFADDEPIAFTPRGAYTGTAEAASRVAWRFASPLEVFGFAQFATGFHKPDVVRGRLTSATSDVTTGLVRPPRIEVKPPAATVSGPELELAVSATSARRIDVIRAYREGREVASVTPCKGSAEATLRVPLLGGTNTISVQAFDDLGYASNPAAVRVTRSDGPQPELYMVSVGVGAYPRLEPRFQLGYATADATAISAAFDSDKRFTAVHKQLLLDNQASINAILHALDGLASMKADDLAIVFLAGHGIKPTADADMVFVTAGASLDAASLAQFGLPWGKIAERLARAKGRVVVLLDACHSGHISQDLVVPNDKLATALASEGRAGVIVFAAAKGRQSSYEPSGATRGFDVAPAAKPLVGGEHGFFTGALLASLRDPMSDRDGDGVIEMSEWIAATTDRVSHATEGLQTPWVARQELFGDFGVVYRRSQ